MSGTRFRSGVPTWLLGLGLFALASPLAPLLLEPASGRGASGLAAGLVLVPAILLAYRRGRVDAALALAAALFVAHLVDAALAGAGYPAAVLPFLLGAMAVTAVVTAAEVLTDRPTAAPQAGRERTQWSAVAPELSVSSPQR